MEFGSVPFLSYDVDIQCIANAHSSLAHRPSFAHQRRFRLSTFALADIVGASPSAEYPFLSAKSENRYVAVEPKILPRHRLFPMMSPRISPVVTVSIGNILIITAPAHPTII